MLRWVGDGSAPARSALTSENVAADADVADAATDDGQRSSSASREAVLRGEAPAAALAAAAAAEGSQAQEGEGQGAGEEVSMSRVDNAPPWRYEPRAS